MLISCFVVPVPGVQKPLETTSGRAVSGRGGKSCRRCSPYFVHLSETPTTTIFKNESYILLYFLKKYRIIKIKDNKLDFIYFLNNFINGKGVVGVI
jgi:hypothetical protein